MLRSQWPLNDDDYYTLERYEAFQAAAEYVARAFGASHRCDASSSLAQLLRRGPWRLAVGAAFTCTCRKTLIWLYGSIPSPAWMGCEAIGEGVQRLWQEKSSVSRIIGRHLPLRCDGNVGSLCHSTNVRNTSPSVQYIGAGKCRFSSSTRTSSLIVRRHSALAESTCSSNGIEQRRQLPVAIAARRPVDPSARQPYVCAAVVDRSAMSGVRHHRRNRRHHDRRHLPR